MRTPRHRIAHALLGSALSLGLLAGCVSEDAGYQDVRKVVSSRTGHEVRWGHLEGEKSSDSTVRSILARSAYPIR
jgi:hypothetical protein